MKTRLTTCGAGFLRFCLAFFCVFLSVAAVRAEWKTFGVFSRVVETKANRVILETSSRSKISVEFFDLNVVRVRYAANGVFERDFSYAFDETRDHRPSSVKVTQTAKEIVLTSSEGAKIVVNKASLTIEIFDENGASIVKDDAQHPAVFDAKTGEIQTTKLRKSELETYYGFGEKSFAGMSRNGQSIVNWNTDTFSYPIGTDPIYQSIPFFYALYSGKTYGLFFNNTFRTYFDMGKTSPERYTFGANGGELDYFVFTGGKDRTPKQVLTDYANLTGTTPLPPIWSLGNQQSRWSYYPEKRVREIADGFRANKIPADVIYLDIDYMNGYRVFTWDKTRFPDPAKMISDLKDEGFKTVLIIDPGIKKDENYATYNDGVKNGIFVKNPDGSELNKSVWAGNSAFPDFTNPKAREWFGAQYKVHLTEGIAGFWNDMNEPGIFMDDKTEKPEIYHHPDKTFPYDTPHFGDGLKDSHRRYHNIYGMQMARSTFEGVKKLQPEKRPFVLTRAGFAGVQRFSAIWTGDNYAGWEHLAVSIPMLANLSVSGVPFVGCDVGGFSDMPSGELYARWLQAAALTPFLRSHSVGWVGNKEPWEYGDDFTKINRATVEMRYRFLPYLYTLFYEHERSGMPVMRPLWFDYPNDKLTYLIDDEYLVGGDVLVAPIIKQGTTKREVYFPVGDDWIDFQTGEKFAGGSKYTIDAPLEKLPVYARVGAVIPTQNVIQNTTEMPNSPITLNVISGIADGKTETSELFQDAGDGYGYRKNDSRVIKIENKQGSLNLTRTGNFNGQKLQSVEIIGIERKPQTIKVDGKTVENGDFDAKRKRLKIEIADNLKDILLVR